MSSDIWVALLALVGTIFGSLLGKQSMTRMLNYRISILENKVDNLSGLLERMKIAEMKIDDINEYVRDNCE